MLTVIYLKLLNDVFLRVCVIAVNQLPGCSAFQCGLNGQKWSVSTLPKRPLQGLMRALSASPSSSDALPVSSENVRNVSLLVKLMA